MPRRASSITIVLAALGLTLLPAGPRAAADDAPSPRAALADWDRQPAWPADAVPGSLLVTRGGRGGPVVEQRSVEPGQEAIEAARLRDGAGVIAVEPDWLRKALIVPDDPDYADQWSHGLTGAAAAWDHTTGSAAVEVAIIDTGVEGAHPDLTANLVEQVDVTSGSVVDVGLGVDNDACDIGHGTFVAGVLGAVGGNGSGVAGVAWDVSIIDIAAGDPMRCGMFSDSAVLAGLEYAVASGVDVVNLSLGAPADTCPTAFQQAIDTARAADVVVVSAAGNDEEFVPGLTSVPASCNGVISVGAVGETGAHARYSNANASVDLVAPGGDSSIGRGVRSTSGTAATGFTTTSEEGTSFAAPYVTGAVALLRSMNQTLDPEQVEAILESTAFRSSSGRTAEMGWGLVELDDALAKVASGLIPRRPAADPDFPIGLVARLSAKTASTDPVTQAVAVSRFVYDPGGAVHAVIARQDDFADALAGSSLGFGMGPVLFSARTGPLAAATAEELQRVLPPGAPVYVLGGPAALPATLETELRTLGYQPRRLAGATRFQTASLVASEVVARVTALGFLPPSAAIVATSHQWPDAVSAGSIGAWFGVPILLTQAGSLDAAARTSLQQLDPDLVYVIGGPAAVSAGTEAAIRTASGAGEVVRLAGANRAETAVAVAREMRNLIQADFGVDPVMAVGVNLRRDGGFAHVISASAALGAFSGVFLPLEGTNGDVIPGVTSTFACEIEPARGAVAGETDMVGEATKVQLNSLLERTAC